MPSYRDFTGLQPGGLYYNYNPVTGMPMTGIPQATPTRDPTAPGPTSMPRGLPPSIDPGGGNQSGIAGQNPDTSVSPSSVTSVGMQGLTNGNVIGGMMGLAMGLAPGPVGLIGLAPSVVDALGIQGLTNNGIAANNQTSTNNAAVDAGQIEGLANVMGIGPESQGPVSDEAAAASPGANAPSPGTVSGANANPSVGPSESAAAAAASAAAAAAAAGGSTGAAAPGADAGPGGAGGAGAAGSTGTDAGTWKRGGRVYDRFKYASGGPVSFTERDRAEAIKRAQPDNRDIDEKLREQNDWLSPPGPQRDRDNRRPIQAFAGGGRPYGIKSRNANFPGIWDHPGRIAEDAVEYTAPESPAMKDLFGYSRGDLYERFKDRVGNVPGRDLIALPKNPKGADAAKDIMTPRNAQRLQDILAEGERMAPDMTRGMHSWYAMDPVYERLRELHGDDMADQLYRRFNTFTGMASPQSTVPHEISRGTAANTLNNQGRFGDFEKWGNVPAEDRANIGQFPPDLMHMPGSIAHATAQAGPMRKFVDTDEIKMTKPKVPLYIGASSVPSLGFQSDTTVPDSHFSRGIGLSDARAPGIVRANSSMSMPEISDIAPWFKREVSDPLGIEAVPAQARLWGLMSNRTGVESPVGSPKLEMLSDHIMKRARELGIDPAEARDAIISGEKFARGGRADPFGSQRSEDTIKSSPVPRSMEHLYRQFTRPRLV